MVTNVLGGAITLDSEVGRGTCLELELPLTAPEQTEKETDPEPDAARPETALPRTDEAKSG